MFVAPQSAEISLVATKANDFDATMTAKSAGKPDLKDVVSQISTLGGPSTLIKWVGTVISLRDVIGLPGITVKTETLVGIQTVLGRGMTNLILWSANSVMAECLEWKDAFGEDELDAESTIEEQSKDFDNFCTESASCSTSPRNCLATQPRSSSVMNWVSW